MEDGRSWLSAVAVRWRRSQSASCVGPGLQPSCSSESTRHERRLYLWATGTSSPAKNLACPGLQQSNPARDRRSADISIRSHHFRKETTQLRLERIGTWTGPSITKLELFE